MSSIVNVYSEFIDSNMDKRYPLMDTYSDEGSLVIPESFLADIKICIGMMDNPGDDSFCYNTYISNITIYPDYIYITIATKVSGGFVDIAKSDPIPVDLTVGSPISGDNSRSIKIRPISDIPINGIIVIGTCKDISKYPGSWDIHPEYGKIFPANVIVMPDVINYIKVGDDMVTGDITLEAGDNVDIIYDKSTNTIKISVKAPSDAIVSANTLLDAVVQEFGPPICAINDVTPIDGNIVIAPSDCLTVETGSNTITFYNPCGNTCASEEFMADTYTRISDLNKNTSVLSSFYSSVSNTLAQMGVRVASVLENRAQAT